MLLLFIFGFVLLPQAFTLKCLECIPEAGKTCTDAEKQCTSEFDQCGSFRTLTYNGNSKVSDVQSKRCAKAAECIKGTIDYGVFRTVLATECCTTDLCNKQYPPEPKQSNPNGMKCFRCDGQTCTGTVNCKGDEDRCASRTVVEGGQMLPKKGCASEAMCSATAAAITGTTGDLSCCQGEYCNSASGTSAGLLILVVPLVSLIFLS